MNKPEYDKNKAELFLKNIKGQSQNFEVLKPSALDLQSVHQEQDLDTALNVCIKACEFEPDNAYVKFMTGCVLGAREQFDEALKYILKAEELGYTDAELYCKLSWLYLNFEDNDKAYFYAKKAVEKDENYGEAWMRLGYSLYNTANAEKVFEAFKKAMDLGYEDGFMNAVTALCLCDLGDWQSAQKYASKGLALSKDNPFCLMSQGIVLAKKGDYKKALKYLDKAYKLDNTLYNALFFKGYVYINMNKHKKALETILSIPEQERTDPTITLNISICFFNLKNYTQAEIYLKKALDSEIKDPEIFEFAAYYLYFYKKDKKLGAAYARMALELEDTKNPDNILQIARMIVKKESGKKVSLNSLTGSYEKDKKDIAWASAEWGWLVFYYLKLVFFSVMVWYMVCRIFLLILPTM